jgi:hypothetical protein
MKKAGGFNCMLALRGMSKLKTILCEKNNHNIFNNKSLNLNNYPAIVCLKKIYKGFHDRR